MVLRTAGTALAGAAVLAGGVYAALQFEPSARFLRTAIGAEQSGDRAGFPAPEKRPAESAPAEPAQANSSPGDSQAQASPPSESDDGLPLTPERKASFSLTSGTWISLDLSPDGRSIVFELLGDIFTMPANGGAATPVLSGMAFETQPVWSPDGSKIAFLSDRGGSENLWIADADGSNPKMLSAGDNNVMASPAWSADGDYVFVSKSSWSLGVFEIWMFHKDGGAGVQITQAAPAPGTPPEQRWNALGPSPSADGRYLYYAAKNDGFGYNLTLPQWNVYRRDLDNGAEDLVVTAQGSAMRPLVSPDGRSLVYATRHDAETGLRIRDLRTGADRWLAYPVTRDDQESTFTRDLMPSAAFTPDSRALIMNIDGGIKRIDIATGEIQAIPFTADVTLDLGPDLGVAQRVETGPVKARVLQSPAEAPNAPRYAFSALGELYVHDVVSGVTRKLEQAGTAAFQPAWSPDGRTIAYITWTAAGGDVWRIPASGGTPTRVSRISAFYSNPAFTSDGSEIVALRASNAAYVSREVDFGPTPGIDLVRLPAGGGEARLVTHAGGLGSPHFASERERVYVYSAGGLMSMRLDGSDRRTHVQVKGPGAIWDEEPVPASDIRISPDGTRVLATIGNQLYLTLAPRFDRTGATIDISSPSIPAKRLSDIGADYFGWSADGSAFFWSVGSTIHRMRVADVSFAAGEEDAEPKDAAAGAADGEAEAEEGTAGDAEDLAAWEPKLRENEAMLATYEVDIEAPRDVPQGAILLRGAKVVTMAEPAVLEAADILVEGARIAAVAPQGAIEPPPGARVIDVAGKVIAPGFIDTHAHWFEIRRGVIEPNHWGFLANLAYGVTAGLDVQTATNDMFAYQDMIDTGRMLGLRAFSTGPGVFSDNRFQSKDEAYGLLKKYRDHYRTRNIKAYLSGDRKQRQYVIQAAKKLGMMPTTEGALDLELDMTHAIDGFWGSEHSLPITPLQDDVVGLFAQSGIAYTPTLLVAYGGPWAENAFYATENVHDDEKLRRFTPHDVVDGKALRRAWFHEQEHVYPRLAADAAKILRAGGRIGVGSHGQLQGLGYHWELWALASGGLTPMEALRVATLGGAEIIGYATDLGSIEPGKYADLNIFDADPTENIRNTASISMVMSNGRLYDASTLAQIAPTPTPGPTPWFATSDPPGRD